MATKKRKLPLMMRMIRWAFQKLESVSSRLAGKWAIRIFFRPYRFPFQLEEMDWIKVAHGFNLSYKDYVIQGYTWGTGPAILVMHGWAGRGTQFREFIRPLAENGYKVVAFDAPAHGLTDGKRTDLLELSESLQLVAQEMGPVHAVIGHSLGGTAALLAMKNGLQVNHLVTISTPSVADDIVRQFMEQINGKTQTGEYIKDYVYQQYGVTLHEISASVLASEVSPNSTLVIHDRDDREAPFLHAEAMVKALPDAQTHFTNGLGHTRILKDEAVVEAVSNFVGRIDPETEAMNDALQQQGT